MEKILIVDDEKDMQWILSNLLREEKFEPITTSTAKEALKVVNTSSPDLMLLDLKLPDMDGVEVLNRLKDIDRNLPVIMITAHGDIGSAVKAMKLGAADYVTKPFDNNDLIQRIKKTLRIKYLSREVENLKLRLDDKLDIEDMMGNSPQIQRTLNQIRIVAHTDMTVILEGESGTGKELIAQLIHHNSPRRNKPFIAIDCGTLPESLIESELFGYEKGAFTGADKTKEGRFELADGGTLFLDEVTNLTASAQRRFLRVLEERKLQKLGGRHTVKIDVRIVVASITNLRDEIRKGTFRKDLFYRLNQFSINIPLVRDRKEDIPVLVKYFLNEANSELKKKIKEISPEAMKAIMEYSWPGNVRELKNAVKRAVLVAKDSILPEHLFLEEVVLKHQDTNCEPVMAPVDAGKDNVPNPVREEFSNGANEINHFRVATNKVKEKEETRLIENALRQAEGNKTKAARILGIERSVLYYKMKKLGMGNG